MKLYLYLNRLGWPSSYLGKILLVSFVGVHVPMIGAVLYVLLADGHAIADSLGIMAALLTATLVGTAATMGITYALLAPVRAAATAMNQYLDGKVLPQLPVRLDDEAGRLMANVQEGLTRLDAALDVARAQAGDASRRSREKFQLISSLSHELRTPLNHIIGFAEMLSSEALGPLGQAKYKDYAGDIGASGGSLLELLQSVLDLTQAEAGVLMPEPDVVSLDDAVRDAVARTHLAAQSAGVAVAVRGIGRARVHADPRLLKQILLHGLHLAIDGAGPGGGLVVQVAEAGSVMAIELVHGGAAWIGDDVPPELRGELGDVPSYSAHAEIASASAAALRLSLLRSLAIAAGGTLAIGTPPHGGRSICISLATAKLGTVVPMRAAA